MSCFVLNVQVKIHQIVTDKTTPDIQKFPLQVDERNHLPHAVAQYHCTAKNEQHEAQI
jgi:hypothetical protein